MAVTVIEVIKPFALRLGQRVTRREFSKGMHTVSVQEMDHWFMRAAIKDGRARVVVDTAGPVEARTKEPVGTDKPVASVPANEPEGQTEKASAELPASEPAAPEIQEPVKTPDEAPVETEAAPAEIEAKADAKASKSKGKGK